MNVINYLCVCNIYSNWLNYILYHHYYTFKFSLLKLIVAHHPWSLQPHLSWLRCQSSLSFSIDNTLDWVATHPGSPLLPPIRHRLQRAKYPRAAILNRSPFSHADNCTDCHPLPVSHAVSHSVSQSASRLVTQSVCQFRYAIFYWQSTCLEAGMGSRRVGEVLTGYAYRWLKRNE